MARTEVALLGIHLQSDRYAELWSLIVDIRIGGGNRVRGSVRL